jgi:hypothetical protein
MTQDGAGAIYEMPSECGSLYLQHIGSNPAFGSAVAVFADAELSEFRFSVVFPVQSAVRQKVIKRVGRSEISGRYKPLRFRYPLGPSGIEIGWMIVENEGQYRVENLSTEQVGFVLGFALNDKALAELFCTGWVEGDRFPTLSG